MLSKSLNNLSFETAEKHMDAGNRISLTNQDEFWFKFKNQIYVLSAECQYFDAHTVDYRVNNDWASEGTDGNAATHMIKALRTNIDDIIYVLGTHVSINREISLVKTELQLGFMWLGYVLKELGAANPYPESFNVNSPQIEKHQQKSEDPSYLLNSMNTMDGTARVKYLRTRTNMFVNILEWIFSHVHADIKLAPKFSQLPVHPGAEAVKHICNAQLWLGQQLNNIRIIEDRKLEKETDTLHKKDLE